MKKEPKYQDLRERPIESESNRYTVLNSSSKSLNFNDCKDIIEFSHEATFVADSAGKIILWNTAMVRLTGVDKPNAIGNYLWDVQYRFVQKENKNKKFYEKLRFDIIRIFNEQECWKQLPYEQKITNLDGTEKTIEISSFILESANGKILVSSFRDITMSKLAEKALRESEEKFRTLIQHSSDPIFSFNPDETYRFVNEAFAHAFGKEPSDIIGKSPFSIFPADEAEKRLTLVRRVFKTGVKGEIEVRVNTILGALRYFSTMADPICDENGKVLFVTCVSKDITDRKVAEEEIRHKNEELLRTNAEKDKFFSIIAHDLRSPFNAFLGFTEMLADEISSFSKEEIQEMAINLKKAASNLFNLLENLLAWSRLQRGLTRFTPESFLLIDKILQCLQFVVASADKKEIEITWDIPEELQIFADANMFDSIVCNIVSNAVKFTPRGGKIIISAKSVEGNEIEISISDSGIGMNKEMLDNLFRLDIQSSRQGTDGESGTGLGLILCKDFIGKHGGRIWAESEFGLGSKFYFTLPAKEFNVSEVNLK